ncbi:MAG: hypothetical protein J7L07_05385, partial [Candidatus Odinarchaeota archaeon]|nr:hypothetical protein [Candidatus Odinarchaeota archaeon]
KLFSPSLLESNIIVKFIAAIAYLTLFALLYYSPTPSSTIAVIFSFSAPYIANQSLNIIIIQNVFVIAFFLDIIYIILLLCFRKFTASSEQHVS